MNKFFKAIVLLLLLSLKTFSQTKEYNLLDKTINADINHILLKKVLQLNLFTTDLLNGIFKPINGNFIVYRFLSTYKGFSYTGKQKYFHDILIVKTNNNNKIVSAYQYTLEWSEPPIESDLYVSSCKNTYLKDSMMIDKFKFEKRWDYDKDDRKLHDTAIINFKMKQNLIKNSH
jgi:hypothetical protein